MVKPTYQQRSLKVTFDFTGDPPVQVRIPVGLFNVKGTPANVRAVVRGMGGGLAEAVREHFEAALALDPAADVVDFDKLEARMRAGQAGEEVEEDADPGALPFEPPEDADADPP